MFEKEAEEYSKHSCFTEYPNPSLSEAIDISDEIKEAVLYGYNKAIKWYYPNKGEYPTEKELVLCLLWNNISVVAFIREDGEWSTNGKNAFSNVKCWQHIVPPKEQRMTEKLKKCPFCGGKATLTEYKFATYKCKVECTTFGCGISTMLYEGKIADKEAIEAWNKRVK